LISLIQTAEGGLQETHDILQRMRELAVQGANDTNEQVDRDAIQEELDSLKTEITRIGKSTQFNGKNLLDGTLGSNTTLGSDLTVTNGIQAVTTNGTAAGAYTIAVEAGTSGAGFSKITVDDGNGSTQVIDDIATPGAGATSSVTFDAFGITLELNEGIETNGQANISTTAGAAETITVAASGVDLQIGANNETEQKLNITIDDMKADALGVGGSTANAAWSVDDVDVSNATNARESIDVLEKAINQVSTQRSKLGAYQNRLDHTINNLGTSAENLTAAESRIRDVDMAKEMMEQTKNSILAQASQAMLAQANQQPQGVLQLLR
jgi:flagellin